MPPTQFKPFPGIRWHWLVIAGLAMLLLAAVLFRKLWRGDSGRLGRNYPFTMLEILAEDTVAVLAYPLNNYIWSLPGGKMAIPVGEEELLAVLFPGLNGDNFHTISRRSVDGSHWQIAGDSNFLYINGSLTSVILDTFPRAARWLEENRTGRQADLRVISLKGKPSETCLAALSDLLQQNPQVRLHVDRDSYDSLPQDPFERFAGRVTIIPIYADDLDRPADSLLINAAQEEHTIYLDRGGDTLLSDQFYRNLEALFPAGRRIVLSDFRVEEMERIVSTMQPYKVMIIESDTLEDLDFLSGLGDLRALEISSPVADLTGIGRHSQLEWLAIRPMAGAKGLEEIRQLRYLAIKASPEDFIPVLHNNPELRFLDISRDTTLRDLRVLLALPHLRGLALPEIDSLDLSAIAQLPDLHYVGILPPAENEEQAALERIRVYCPDCLVYFSENYFFGICLGSGWLVFLAPLAILIGLAIGFIRRSTGTRTGCH